MLSGGLSGLGTKTTSIASLMNRSDAVSDTELVGKPPVLIDEAFGEELNERLIRWSENIGLYEVNLDYLENAILVGM